MMLHENSKIKYFKAFFIFGLILVSAFLIFYSDSSAQVNCLDPANAANPECVSPRLKGLQQTVVNLIYLAWVAGIPIFTGLGALIGVQYMTSGADADAKAALQRRGLYWVISIIIYFASQPIAGAIMKFFIQTTSDCYLFLDTPGFTFFFSDVCNPVIVPGGPGPAPGPVVGPIAGDTDGIGNCCADDAGCHPTGQITDGAGVTVNIPQAKCTTNVTAATCGTQLKCEESVIVTTNPALVAINGKPCDAAQHNRQIFFAIGAFNNISAVGTCDPALSVWVITNSPADITAGMLRSEEDGVGGCCTVDGPLNLGDATRADGCFGPAEIKITIGGTTHETIHSRDFCRPEAAGPTKKCATNNTCSGRIAGQIGDPQIMYDYIKVNTVPCLASNLNQIVNLSVTGAVGSGNEVICTSDGGGAFSWKIR